jgi:hypothetical protein
MAQQKTTIKINPKYNKEQREAIAQEIIDYMIDRTLKSKDKNNRNFKPYSKEYKQSLDFKNAGKTSKVNLTLSGDMLVSMDLLNSRKGSITIGYQKGSEENDKAEGNIKGTYGSTRKTKIDPKTGKRVPRQIKKRDFLGISGNDLRSKILSKFPLTRKEDLAEQVATTQITQSLSEQLAAALALRVDDE